MRTIIFTGLLSLFFSCENKQPTPPQPANELTAAAPKELPVDSVAFTVNPNYFAKKSAAATKDGRVHLALTGATEFTRYFGPAATMKKQEWIDEKTIADGSKMIIGIIDTVTIDTKSLTISSITRQGNTMTVNYIVEKTDKPRSSTAQYNVVATVERKGVNEVVFKEKGKELARVKVM